MAKKKSWTLYIVRVNGVVQVKTWSLRKKEAVERMLRNGGAWYETEVVIVPAKSKKVVKAKLPIQLSLF